MSCRRCTECEGRTHHWFPDPHDRADLDDEDRLLKGAYGCKHCDQRGEECPVCGGEGGDYNFPDREISEEEYEDFHELCGCCKGEGVITVEDFASLN